MRFCPWQRLSPIMRLTISFSGSLRSSWRRSPRWDSCCALFSVLARAICCAWRNSWPERKTAGSLSVRKNDQFRKRMHHTDSIWRRNWHLVFDPSQPTMRSLERHPTTLVRQVRPANPGRSSLAAYKLRCSFLEFLQPLGLDRMHADADRHDMNSSKHLKKSVAVQNSD